MHPVKAISITVRKKAHVICHGVFQGTQQDGMKNWKITDGIYYLWDEKLQNCTGCKRLIIIFI
jgi:hypothetical protein